MIQEQALKSNENVHDSNFKHNFENKQVAKDFFIEKLPRRVLRKVDLTTLSIESPEFIPSKYRGSRQADILYSVELKRKKNTKKKRRVYVLLHLEAQSTHDKNMAIRILEYHVAIAKAHMRREQSRKIPLILTYILYNGADDWTSAKSIAELFEDFDLYVEIALKAPFLINLGEESIDNLKKARAAAAPQLIMKGNVDKDYCSMLQQLYPLMKQYKQDGEENIDYMAINDKEGVTAFLNKLSKIAPNIKNYKNMLRLALEKECKRQAKEITQKVTQEVTQKVTQDVTKKVTQDVTKKVTQDVTKKVTQDVTQRLMEQMIQHLSKLGVSQEIIARVQRKAKIALLH